MYSSDTNKVRKEISSISQLKTNLDNTMKENKDLKDQLTVIDSFFTQMNLKRYCSHYAEGTTSDKVKKYFEYLEVIRTINLEMRIRVLTQVISD